MKQQYKQIAPAELEVAYASAWSIENMEGHGAGNRQAEYIGSICDGDRLTDYYKDTNGAYWYGTRVIVNGKIVTIEEGIFGKKMKRRYKKEKS